MSSENQNKSNSSVLGILFLAVFIDLLGFGIIIPLLPLWVESNLGESVIVYGLLVSSYSFMQFIFSPLWGKVSDSRGRRPVILVGLFGSVIGFSLLTISFTVVKTIEMLFLSRIISGMFTAATLPTAQAVIADSTTGKDRAKGFGLIGAAFGLGFALGPGLGGVLYLFNIGAPAILTVVLSVINLLWAFQKMPETLTEDIRKERAKQKNLKLSEQTTMALLKTSPTIPLIITMFSILTIGFVGLETTLILLGYNRFGMDETTGGLVLLAVGVVAIITQGGLIKPLTNRFSDEHLSMAGLVFLIIGFLGMSTVHTLLEMIFWVIPLSFGSSIGNPTLNSLLSKQAPNEKSGEVLGLNQGLSSFQRIIGPIIATALFTINDSYPYYLSSALFVICFLLGFVLLNKLKNVNIYLPVLDCKNCGQQLLHGSAICQFCGQTTQ